MAKNAGSGTGGKAAALGISQQKECVSRLLLFSPNVWLRRHKVPAAVLTVLRAFCVFLRTVLLWQTKRDLKKCLWQEPDKSFLPSLVPNYSVGFFFHGRCRRPLHYSGCFKELKLKEFGYCFFVCKLCNFQCSERHKIAFRKNTGSSVTRIWIARIQCAYSNEYISLLTLWKVRLNLSTNAFYQVTSPKSNISADKCSSSYW